MAQASQKPQFAQADLTPYPGVIDCADVHSWTSELDHRKGVFVLSIYDGKKLVARGQSGHMAPAGIRRVGQIVSDALEKSGRLS